MISNKREKKKERRKKREENKKMTKKLTKLAEGKNKYNVNGNYIEEFQKDAEKNPDLLVEDNKQNFEDFDYNADIPEEIKKNFKKIEKNIIEESVNEEREILKISHIQEESFEEDECNDDFSDLNLDEDEKKNEEVMKLSSIANVIVKVKELPNSVVIFDNDLQINTYSIHIKKFKFLFLEN